METDVKEEKQRVRTLTKKEIEFKLAQKTEGKKVTEKFIVDAMFETLRELLMTANPSLRIEVRDFGVFEIKTTKPKPKARNLKTGDFVYVPARKKIHFKPGKLLKEFLKKPL